MEHNIYNVFIVDSDLNHANSIKNHMHSFKNCHFFMFTNAEDCLAQMDKKPALVFLDYELQPLNKDYKSSDILKKIKQANASTEVVLFTGSETVEVIQDTLKLGAFDYYIKDHLSHIKAELLIERLLDIHETRDEHKKYKKYAKTLIGGLIVFSIIIIILYMIHIITDNVGGNMF